MPAYGLCLMVAGVDVNGALSYIARLVRRISVNTPLGTFARTAFLIASSNHESVQAALHLRS